MQLAGHIKVLGGPYVARGPDVAQACLRQWMKTLQRISNKILKMKKNLENFRLIDLFIFLLPSVQTIKFKIEVCN